MLIATIVILEGYANLKPVLLTIQQMQPSSDQVLLYRKEPTFIQTHRFSLESKVLDFTHANKNGEYQISSCQQFWHSLRQFYHDFLEKTLMTSKSFPMMKKVGTIADLHLSPVSFCIACSKSWSLVFFFFFFFKCLKWFPVAT